jgi:ribosome-associated protein
VPLQITEYLSLPEEDLAWTASRSSGPGGQNVNKVNSRVTLRFDLAGTAALSPEQKARIATRLASRLGRDGVLRVTAQRHRTQPANLEAARDRLAELLREALTEAAPRVDTRPTFASRRERIDDKTRRGRIKRERSYRPADD